MNLVFRIQNEIETLLGSPKFGATGSCAGRVVSSANGLVKVVGLHKAKMEEVLEFEGGAVGVVASLESYDELVAVILGQPDAVKAGEVARSTGDPVRVPVGRGMLGRVVNALGEPIDDQGPLCGVEYVPSTSPSPSINDRQCVHEPYHTGIKVIDLTIPIGRGQRELIIGDRATGKTTMALDSIIHQHKINSGVVGIYVAIGQRRSAVASLIQKLQETGALANSIVVVASASEPAIMQLLAPLTGCAIGEYFMRQGEHAVVVYDDLTRHAKAHRQNSLLLRLTPGREAYPGDVFYLHARLLERAAKLSEKLGGGSLTALPIFETEAGDSAAYMPTNVISITDGQVFLSATKAKNGKYPAVDVGLSVSRVGSAAQWPATKKIVGNLRTELSQYEDTRKFEQFATNLDPATQLLLDRGAAITQLLHQKAHAVLAQEVQCCLFYAFKNNVFDLKQVTQDADLFVSILEMHGIPLLEHVRQAREIDLQAEKMMEDCIQIFKVRRVQSPRR
jgi:proton translocating ATP synthase F1 alpha subunit